MMPKNEFWKSTVYKIIRAMHETGNQPGVIAQWKEMVETWATTAQGPEAEAVKAWLPAWQVRPFYRPAELAPMMPALALALGFADRLEATRSVGRLVHELDYGGLPFLKQADGNNLFRSPITGILDAYYIVERIHYWRNRSVTQKEFEEFFNG